MFIRDHMLSKDLNQIIIGYLGNTKGMLIP